ncbi:iron complex transport system substrate-binding protein [Saccharopolyspora erythraea NRRL 2338]|uniref:ABC Fe(3+) transporter, substrate binding component n=2 Tax=Saccharopolyspora erythraea TaxID=1836 RepID=A4F985_SACEN|nr:iron-siderophore ABC transporter substrate-binding protein [Saccharopolyspora erythraea]EQD86559.1 iron ABC transporter substrate-binding protein [Saccharopolyspora erythraea D]PFG94403.1 iron complex transport system substrate-binding protein [Saccharopolyspora erythraea NRRL 2338]QRK91165.1 iron-siderophore ABC transporter substrate-binding protein [Saccharopolyspora erythraea]CAM00610.1 ABC Fe(3+) transporter, substrate binding component [Saccharopolyspora erythraea NRRL 2338]
MSRSRRLIAAVVAAVGLATTAACGTSGPDQPAAAQQGERVINHAKGQTRISGTPQRVVVLDTGELDAVLALGVKPVGTVQPDVDIPLQPYLADKAGSPEIVGTIGNANLEKIAALKPDLILSSKVRDDDKYDALSKIAPTVFAETAGSTWKENFLLDADALGKKPEAERVLADYHRRAADIGRTVGDPGAIRVGTMRFITGGNEIRLYNRSSFIGTVLADAGFNRPDNQLAQNTTFTKISREEVSQAEADLLFYSAYGDSAQQRLNELVASEQWRNLAVVRNGKAIAVPDDRWFLALGPIGANLVLDDLQNYVAKR